MKLNPIIILMGVLLVVLMVAFGHHRSAKNALNQTVDADITDSSDPLVQAIEEHNKLQQQNYFSMPNAASNPGAYGNGNTGFPSYLLNNPYLRRNAPKHTVLPGMNPYEAANPYHSPMMQAPAPASQPAPPQDNYYPPPAGTALPPHSDTELDRKMEKVLPFLNLPGQTPLRLATGQKIAFVGTAAYAVDAKGWPTPLPDGRYPIYNGQVTIIIRGGHKSVN